jgi:hypothetical protein
MRCDVRRSPLAIAAVLGLVALTARVVPAACVGDCNGNGSVTAGELTKIISIINLCDGAAAGCAAIPGADQQCTNADKNGNGVISAGELTETISDIINFASGCPPESATPTPTLTQQPTPSPTATTGGVPLGTRVFSLGASSGFFSSLVPSLKAGTPAGTLMLNAGPKNASGQASVTLSGAPVTIQTSIALGGLTLCTKIESCTGTLYCNGGANVDTVAQLDSLAPGLTCTRDGTHSCPATSTFCCSNACEGVGVGSGNPTVRTSGVNTTDSGAGSMLLMCQERIVSVNSVGADCSTVDYSSAAVTNELYTTGTSTAKVSNHCAGSGAPSTKAVTFAKTGEKFDCSAWTTENGAGGLAFSIPSEEGSAQFTGDGANAGVFSDH